MESLKFNNVTQAEEIPEPEQSANAFFHFVKNLNYLEHIIINRKLPIWYVKEDVSYLNLPNIEYLFMPMKCFCDINLHKMQSHMKYYGNYGIAFFKDWGINHKLQPVQYMNEKSFLTEQYISSFKASLNDNESVNVEIKNYLSMNILYMKPIIGDQIDTENKPRRKYFLDESEWRYIFDVSNLPDCEQLYVGNSNNDMKVFNEALLDKNQGLEFDIKDIKYIIINTEDEFIKLISNLKTMNLTEDEKYLLVSKILIWEQSRRDF